MATQLLECDVPRDRSAGDPTGWARLARAALGVPGSDGQVAADPLAVMEATAADSEIDLDARNRFTAELLAATRMVPATAQQVADRMRAIPELAGRTPGERALLACLAGELGCTGEPCARVAELAHRALADGCSLRR